MGAGHHLTWSCAPLQFVKDQVCSKLTIQSDTRDQGIGFLSGGAGANTRKSLLVLQVGIFPEA